MKLLVTGGAGFIGSAFVRRRLAMTEDEVTVLDKLTYAGSLANLEACAQDQALRTRYRFVHGDIADQDLVRDLIDGMDAVVNFAAESHVDRSILDPTAFLRTGVMGVHALLEATRLSSEKRGRADGVRFVQVSTDEVYGSVVDGQSREDDALDPRSPYSAAKAAGELLARAYRATFGLDVVISRGSNTYGPHQHPEKLIPLFITNAMAEQPLPLYGEGNQRRDWLYVDDHADGVGYVLDHGVAGRAYNVCGADERTNREVTQILLSALGKPWTLVRSVPDRPGHDMRYSMDGSLLASLGWEPRVRFEEGIRRTIAWYLEHEDWWRGRRDSGWDEYYAKQYGWRLERSVQA